jgi:predicted dehydrogenase
MRVIELMNEGVIGQPYLFEAHFSYLLRDLRNIRLSAERLGGALMDVGCYGIDAARLILSTEPSEVTANMVFGHESGVDELTTLTLRFGDSTIAQITASTRLRRRHEYRVHGDLGSIILPDAFIPQDEKETEVCIVSDATGTIVESFPRRSAFGEEIKHIAKAFRAGEPSMLMPLEDGFGTARVLAAARASAVRGTTVSAVSVGL